MGRKSPQFRQNDSFKQFKRVYYVNFKIKLLIAHDIQQIQSLLHRVLTDGLLNSYNHFLSNGSRPLSQMQRSFLNWDHSERQWRCPSRFHQEGDRYSHYYRTMLLVSKSGSRPFSQFFHLEWCCLQLARRCDLGLHNVQLPPLHKQWPHTRRLELLQITM